MSDVLSSMFSIEEALLFHFNKNTESFSAPSNSMQLRWLELWIGFFTRILFKPDFNGSTFGLLMNKKEVQDGLEKICRSSHILKGWLAWSKGLQLKGWYICSHYKSKHKLFVAMLKKWLTSCILQSTKVSYIIEMWLLPNIFIW